MAELFGKADGCSGGKGGSMHLFDAAKRLHGRARHRGRPPPARDRARLRDQVPRRRPGLRLLLRRGGRQHRRLPRSAQHGVGVEAPGDLPVREQPLRHGHRVRAGGRGHGRRRARLQLRHGRRSRERHGRAGGPPARWSAPCSAPARAGTPPCSRCAPIASWATRCPTRCTASTAPRTKWRSRSSATRSSSTRSGCSRRRATIDQAGLDALDAEVRAEVEDGGEVRRRESRSGPRTSCSRTCSRTDRCRPSPIAMP